MEEVAATIRDWMDLGWRTAFGRIIDIQGFGGSNQVELIAMNEFGNVAGGLLSGSIDDVILPAAREVLAGPPEAGMQVVVGDVHGDAVLQAGLACGGTAHVLVQVADDVAREFWTALVDQTPVALATVIEGPGTNPRTLTVTGDAGVWGSLDDPVIDEAVAVSATALLTDGTAAIRRMETELGIVLVEALVPAPRVVVVGAGALADALVFQAAILGWQGRIAADIEAADAALAWAGQSGAVVVLSHVPSLDAPASAAAIGHGAFYLGALGSRRTQAARAHRLQSLGVSDDDLDRVRGPVGLDLGGQTPALIALAVCAEILAVRTGRDAMPLRHRQEPIRPQTIRKPLSR
jgi:xanthine dehydrogenase accessory factor